MVKTLVNAWKIADLRKKILYTLAMLIIFRLGASITVPGVDKALLAAKMSNDNGFLGYFNLMSGGAFKQFTIFALGISPYITASIVMNLLQIAIPSLEALAKEGEAGRKKIARYTRYLTVVLAALQAYGLSATLFRSVFYKPGTFSILIATLTLTAGTAFLMYLGEKINEKGIGNGISLFIFAGIIARLPVSVYKTARQVVAGTISIFSVLLFLLVALAIIVGVIFIQQGQRKINVQYSKRVIGRKMYGGQSSHIPLKVNQTGVIPVIFAISILMFPQTIATFFPNSGFYRFMQSSFNSTTISYNIIYALLIIAFTYFYTSVTFNPIEISNNMKKNGGFIPGIRPGRPTTDYLMNSMSKLTIVGALFLAAIATLPNFILAYSQLKIRFGGTALLIVVGVALETMKQIEAQMLMRHYKGFLK